MVSSTVGGGGRGGKTPVASTPFTDALVPNAVSCIDFNGAMTRGDGVRCGPLTIIDAYSRFCIARELQPEATSGQVMRVLDAAARQYGTRAARRPDNGPPLASTGAGGLTRLSAWLLRLGIRLERMAPGNPQQNGRLERFHRSLEAESASQCRAFYVFRKQYNEERPHEASA